MKLEYSTESLLEACQKRIAELENQILIRDAYIIDQEKKAAADYVWGEE